MSTVCGIFASVDVVVSISLIVLPAAGILDGEDEIGGVGSGSDDPVWVSGTDT